MFKVSPKLTAKPGYKPQAEDTSIETDLLQFYLLRQRSNSDRLQMAGNWTRGAKRLSLMGLHQQFAQLDRDSFARKVAIAWLQEQCPPNFTPQGDEMTWIQDSNALGVLLHNIFVNLGIAYYVTGGVAAIAYGEPRTTTDIDIVCFLLRSDVDRLAVSLESHGFYVPNVDDLKSGRMQMIGVTHIETVARADLVLPGVDEFDRVKFERRRLLQIPGGELYFASPEDVILNKLRWSKRSRSEKQWRDVLGVLKVQGETLDFAYLRHWAERLNLVEDLSQATVEAGI